MPRILLTGAAGFIGRAVHRLLCKSGVACIAIDKNSGSPDQERTIAGTQILTCDLTDSAALDAVFASHYFDSIVHLAAVLPGAASRDPIRATQVNVTGSMALLDRAVRHGVQRFVFGSSSSVYGAAGTSAPISESAAAAPIDAYGAAKQAVEIVGENLQRNGTIQFVALRIATVIGPGARNTSSPWRAEIFEKLGSNQRISLPYAKNDLLTVVHVDDVARMLVTLTQPNPIQHTIYNTPAELLTASDLKHSVESIAPETHIELTGRTRPLAPLADGSRFAREFGFQITPLEQHLRARLRQGCEQI